MSTGSISLDILLNKILTDAISGGNESIRAIQKRYPSLSEKEAHEILAMVSATAQSNDDSAELVVTAPPSFGKCYAENTFCRFKLWRGWSILICTFNFFDFCAITFNQSHPGEDSRKVRISRL